MPILAAIPALVGAGIAIADAVDGPTDETENLGQHSEASKSAFYSPQGKDNWGGLSGIHGDWQGVGKVAAPTTQGVNSARGQRYGSRFEEGQAMGLLKDYATGEKSAARLEAANAIDQTQAAMASQAAAAGNSPAAQRAAMYGGAAAGQNVAGGVAAAAAKEQLGAQGAYLTGANARRGMDINSQLAEQQWYQQQGAFGLGANQQKQNALGMGMQQADTERNARMNYEAMLRGQSMDQQKLNEQKRQANITAVKDTGIAVAKAVSGAASKPGSDRSVKQGVRPASPDDVFGSANRAMTQRSAASEAARAGMNARSDPRWIDLNDQANQDVFSAGPYDQNWDAAAVQNMKDDEYVRQHTAALGQRQAAANASAQQVPVADLYKDMSDVPADPRQQYDKVSTLTALNSLQGFSDKPVPGTWGNSTLNSIQQLVGSDEKVKKEVTPADVAKFLDKIHPYTYRYKDPDSKGASPGQQVGVMAQDLEKSAVGRGLVSKDGPDGTRMVDYGKAGPLAFAALAQINERLNRVEGKGEVRSHGEVYQPFEVNAGRSGAGQYEGERTRPSMSGDDRTWMAPVRTAEPMAPVAAGNVAVTRNGVPAPGSNLGTLQWLQEQQGAPAWGPTTPTPAMQPGVATIRGGQVQPGSDPATATWMAQQQAEEEDRAMAAYQMAVARGQAPPGVYPMGPLASRTGRR